MPANAAAPPMSMCTASIVPAGRPRSNPIAPRAVHVEGSLIRSMMYFIFYQSLPVPGSYGRLYEVAAPWLVGGELKINPLAELKIELAPFAT